MRSGPWVRQLLAETDLRPQHLIQPLFVTGSDRPSEEIPSMTGVKRLSNADLRSTVIACADAGIQAVALFPVIPPEYRDKRGTASLDPHGVVPRTIAIVREAAPSIGVICDVALDPYTTHGHDGILNADGDVDNDATLAALCRQAIVLAQAQAHMVAPSDMMDGRVGRIRHALDAAGLIHTQILSYAAKYASGFYGPFRDAIGSSSALGRRDKKTYQMDPRNVLEALHEVALDVAEGADCVMIKPAMPFLDVIARVKEAAQMPVFAYQVSGEYAMIRSAISQGLLPESTILETLMSIRRAGASAILSYFALDVARQL